MAKLDNVTELSREVPPTIDIPEATLSTEPQTLGEKPQRSSDEEITAANRFAISEALRGTETPPSIDEVRVSRVTDLITRECPLHRSLVGMGAPHLVASHLAELVYFADTGILTLVPSEEHGGRMAPMLEPDKLRIISRKMLLSLLQQVPGDISAIYSCSGPTGFLYRPASVSNGSSPDVAAYEGLFRYRFTTFGGPRGSESSNVMTTSPGSGRVSTKRISTTPSLPAAVLANLVKSPMAMGREGQEPNPNALLVAIKGRNITPATITSIVREAGYGPLGIFLVADGELESSVMHSLPNDTIEPSALGDYMDTVTADGQFVGSGTASIVDPYSRDGHIHTDMGHFRRLNEGTVWALVYPAQELHAQYQ